jgi:hypothetical protein
MKGHRHTAQRGGGGLDPGCFCGRLRLGQIRKGLLSKFNIFFSTDTYIKYAFYFQRYILVYSL